MAKNKASDKYALIPDFVITPSDRLWLRTILDAAYENRRLTVPEIKTLLKGKLPAKYFPTDISRLLISSNGEEITLLGIRLLEGSDSILKKCDKIIAAIQQILYDNQNKKPVEHLEIAGLTKIPGNVVSLLLLLMCAFLPSFRSTGSRTFGLYGVEFITFDPASYKQIMGTESIMEYILETIEWVENQEKNVPAVANVPTGNSTAKIRWAGNNNQLYDIIRQLKNRDLILNSNHEIAGFLKYTFNVFENVSISTIEKELGREHNLPKAKRIDLGEVITPDNS